MGFDESTTMNVMYYNRQFATRFTPWVLSLWLITLLLLFLSPCCESIAATIPHDHAASTEHTHQHTQALQNHQSDGIEHVNHGQSSPAHHTNTQGYDHQHCGSVDLEQVDYDALLQANINQPDKDKKLYAIYPLDSSPDFSKLSSYDLQHKSYNPPDIKLRVYLKTERLRI